MRPYKGLHVPCVRINSYSSRVFLRADYTRLALE